MLELYDQLMVKLKKSIDDSLNDTDVIIGCSPRAIRSFKKITRVNRSTCIF